jgi:N-acetylneuraminic acid mutarotase
LTNAWLQKADFPWDWKNATGFSAGGQGYITTGTTYGGGNYSSVLVAYDPAANTWTSRAPLPGNARIYATAFTIGNTGHVFGGFGGSGALNDLWAYDPTVDLWTSKAALPAIGRGLSSALALGSVGIVAGGVAETPLNEVWQYNSTTNAWFARSPMVNGARSSAVAFSIGQHGYVGTGYDANLVRTGTFERYTTLEHDCVGVPGGETTPGSSCDDGIASTTDDVYGNDCVCAGIPGTNVWRPRADFAGQGRAFAVSFSIGTKGYVGTGYNGAPLADFWEFDPATNAWTQKADLPGGARERAAGFSIGAKGYIGTGLTGINTMFDDFWEFDPASNIWTQKATFPGGVRQYAVGFSIGSKGYLGLGTAFTLYPTDLYVYDPAIDSWSATSNAEAFFARRWSRRGRSVHGGWCRLHRWWFLQWLVLGHVPCIRPCNGPVEQCRILPAGWPCPASGYDDW